MFLQIHFLTSYHATLLNRDDVGLAKGLVSVASSAYACRASARNATGGNGCLIIPNCLEVIVLDTSLVVLCDGA